MDTSPVLVIVACLFLTVPIAIGGAYLNLKNKYGSDVGKQLALSNFISTALILLIAVAVLSLVFLIGWPNSETIRIVSWLMIVVGASIAVIASLRRRSDIGVIVVELEPRLKISNWIIGIFMVVGIAILVLPFISAEASPTTILGGLAMLSGGVWFYLQNNSKTRFTETGIYVGTNRIKWERVKEYHWLPSQSEVTAVLHLQIRGWLSLLYTSIMQIPSQHKDAVNDLLIRHLSGGSEQ